MNNYILLSVLLILYCFIHSFLISIPVTRFAKRKLGKSFCYYRLMYNIFSLVSILPIMYYANTLKAEIFFSWNGYAVVIKYLLIISGFALVISGSRAYSFSLFSGLKQIKSGCIEENDISSDNLCTTGVSAIIRHPWYTAVILLLWSGNFDYSKLIVNSVFTLYLIIGAYLEEYKLIKAFGDQYREYKRDVSMFVPLKWLRKKIVFGK